MSHGGKQQASTSFTPVEQDKAGKLGGLLAGRRRPGLAGKPRQRSWGLVTLAALLVIGCGLAVAAWGLKAGQKESVLAVREPVAKGHVIERANLISTSVSGVAGAIAVERIDEVAGKSAGTDLVPGQIITEQQVASGAVPGPGFATVGLSLDAARVPGAGLETGDAVTVVAVPPSEAAVSDPSALDAPTVLSDGATVYSAGGAADGSAGSILVTLIVKDSEAERIAAYSAQRRVALVETSVVEDSAVAGE